MSQGKGSTRRPSTLSPKEWADRYNQTFTPQKGARFTDEQKIAYLDALSSADHIIVDDVLMSVLHG